MICWLTTIYKVNVRNANRDIIEKYIVTKVEYNLKKIIEAKRIRDLQKYEEIIINGVAYKNLNYYKQ